MIRNVISFQRFKHGEKKRIPFKTLRLHCGVALKDPQCSDSDPEIFLKTRWRCYRVVFTITLEN